MATYVISDIHGQYDMFMELVDKIKLKETDTLYILGDILDRGPHPIKTIRKLMEMPNAICLVGNHEFMALECLEFLMKEITDIVTDYGEYSEQEIQMIKAIKRAVSFVNSHHRPMTNVELRKNREEMDNTTCS